MTYLQWLTTLVLGSIASIIAWQQWLLSRDRLTYDLFKDRYAVFKDLTKLTASFVPEDSIKDLATFDEAAERARYLFGPEVLSYLREIRTELIRLWGISRSLR